MAMRTNSSSYTIAEYYEQLKNRQITINYTYQRTDKVWPISAKSDLIDTVLNGYPIPKLILSQTTDLDTRKTRKEVVDGQQRTVAIVEFMDNKYALTGGEFSGNRFDDLDESGKRDFLGYSLSVDIFTSATDEEIREVFRRINSYQVPLNKQETRHATHQGEFKRFIVELGKRYSSSFIRIGTLKERQISRMVDLEFLTELVDLLVRGVKTASPKALDKLYTDNDRQFVNRSDIEAKIDYGLGELLNLVEIQETPLVARANLYSLFGAFIAARFPDSIVAEAINERDRGLKLADRPAIISNLTLIAEALEDSTKSDQFAEFLDASRQGTNTEKIEERDCAVCMVQLRTADCE